MMDIVASSTSDLATAVAVAAKFLLGRRKSCSHLVTCLLLSLLAASTGVMDSSTVKDQLHSSSSSYTTATKAPNPRMSFANTTCHFFEQPLDHFAMGSAPTFAQRYCLYDGYQKNRWGQHHLDGGLLSGVVGRGVGGARIVKDHEDDDVDHPIFFYVGNESPVEVYANHTGLMWELSPRFHALIVFAEHRYEGLSKPNFTEVENSQKQPATNVQNCMSYASSAQALADYAVLLSHLNPGAVRPVILFGGSYGGMLASWMRMKYPTIVAGAIASSAPIWGLPLTNPQIDGAFIAISRGVLSETGGVGKSKNGTDQGQCFKNLLAAWPLITVFGKTDYGREILSDSFHLCHGLRNENDTFALLNWAQGPWFLLAEGNFPYPSNYITSAVGPGHMYDLPAWPMRRACEGTALRSNLGIEISGDTSDVRFTVRTKSDDVRIDVDWNVVKARKSVELEKEALERSGVRELFVGVRDAVAIWYNVTKDMECFDVLQESDGTGSDGFNLKRPGMLGTRRRGVGVISSVMKGSSSQKRRGLQQSFSGDSGIELAKKDEEDPSFWALAASPARYRGTAGETCDAKIATEGCWASVVCNENVYLAIYYDRGRGKDFFWPPRHARGTTLADILENEVSKEFAETCSLGSTHDGSSSFGYPSKPDPWSTWLDAFYGGIRIASGQQHSNIVFSNGLLDPWSAAGVYPPSDGPPAPGKYEGPMVRNITKDGTVVSIVLDLGAHHLDLMFSSPEHDPPCAVQARKVQEDHIRRWTEEWVRERCTFLPLEKRPPTNALD